MDESEQFYALEISVTACEPVTFEDLTPVLSELNEHFMTVRVTRNNIRPPMAGALDMVLGIAVVYAGIAGIEFVRKFAAMLAEDAYKGLRERLRRLRDKADEVADERTWTLTIQVGSHPFHFQGPMDDDEFRARLLAAQVILDRSPERLIEADDLPTEMEPGWYWREDHWEPTPLLRQWMDQKW